MEELARGGYTSEEIRDMLHGKYGSRVVKFRYDLLNREEKKIGELKRVTSGEVNMGAFNTIKRTAKFVIEEELTDQRLYYTWRDVDSSQWDELGAKQFRDLWTIDKSSAQKVDWLNDRVQPFVLFQMLDGGWVEFPLGVFLLSSPTKEDSNGVITREVEAYDSLIILDQDKFTERTHFPAGMPYEEAVNKIIRGSGIKKINIQITEGEKLKNDKEYATGDSKLTAVNDLLASINNTPLWVDSGGYFRSQQYERPDNKAVDYTYSDQELSIIVEGIEQELDVFDVANSWVVTVSNPEAEPLTARKDNTNTNSPTSIPSRGRRIVDFREVDEIASEKALNAYVERIASEASQVYGKVKFLTPIMPHHEYQDIVELIYSPLDINDKFAETNWTIKLEAGAMMEHEVRKVVDID